jgi:phytoene dehydrogenase-like protein
MERPGLLVLELVVSGDVTEEAMTESIVIIGAGIAGLAAGCYGQMNGYHTRIFELHNQPGGLCTSWKRESYTFDGCIHWLVGSRQGSGMNRVWQELGAVQGRTMIDHEEFVRVEGSGGKAWIVYTDLDQLERHMKEISPADAPVIDTFCRAARRLSRLGDAMLQAGGLARTLLAGIKLLPALPDLMRYSRISVGSFASRFGDPFLRQAFLNLFDMPDFPLVGVLMTLGWMHNRDAGYPIGGSLAFARAIEKRYLDLGGEIHYRSPVSKILVEEGRAVGVRLAAPLKESGASEVRAGAVISAADGHATLFDMLDGRYLTPRLREAYERWRIFAPIVQVSLGVNCDLSAEPHSASFALDEPVVIAGQRRARMSYKHYCYDPTLAPAGKSVVTTFFPSDYGYWKSLDPDRYAGEKEAVADAVITQLEKRLPAIAGQIEVVDVATPLTYERYTGNWQGSMEGWLPIMSQMGKKLDHTLPGLDNFYMIGQWVEPGGGLPPAATSARAAIQAICKRDGTRFTTNT